MEYLNRYAEKAIEKALSFAGAVVVAGPKFCGKTTTCERFAKSKYALDTKAKILMAEANPEAILLGETPRLIDEWQNVPDLWNCVRSEIDHREEKFGQFLFTGSSTPASKEDIYHSGAGRIATIKMRPFSLFESGESSGEVSLSALFKGEGIKARLNQGNSLLDIAFYICRGGWPLSLRQERSIALGITSAYCDTLFEFENSKNSKFRGKKPSLFRTILRSYARNVSTEARKSKILDDLSKHEGERIDPKTLDDYLEALEDLYIIKDIEAWNPHFRSKTAVITTPTRHFVDTSIATGVLHMSPNDLLEDPNTFGLLFEDFAVKELSIYVDSLGGEIRHYRDGNGLECDAVIHMQDSSYALVEIKLGGETLIGEGIAHLKDMERRLKEEKGKGPSFLMVLTAKSDSYVKDGVIVTPIDMLKD